MDPSQSLTCASIFAPGDDFVAPVRTLAQRPSPCGFLLGAGCAALLVLGIAGGGLFLSRSFIDSMASSANQIGFGRATPLSLSLDIGREARAGGTVG